MNTQEILDPGHKYRLLTLDGSSDQTLTFVKRCDVDHPERFPGNKDAYCGTTVQSVILALVDRIDYLQNQIPHQNNIAARRKLLEVVWLFEDRAAGRHGYSFDYRPEDMDKMPLCPHCGHMVCPEMGNAFRG